MSRPSPVGYPPSVFSLLPKLLERAGTSDRGSITGLYTVLVEGDDMNEPIADAARSVLDGHIVLSRRLATAGHFPSIEVLDSVSRVEPAITTPERRAMARDLRKLLAAARDAKDLIEIGAYVSGTNPVVDRAVALSDFIEAFLCQDVQVTEAAERSWACWRRCSTRPSSDLLRRASPPTPSPDAGPAGLVSKRSFRLETVLRVRKAQEESARADLSRENREVHERRRPSVTSAAQRYRRVPVSSGPSPPSVFQRESGDGRPRRGQPASRRASQLSLAEAQAAVALRHWREAAQRVEALERLEQRRLEECAGRRSRATSRQRSTTSSPPATSRRTDEQDVPIDATSTSAPDQPIGRRHPPRPGPSRHRPAGLGGAVGGTGSWSDDPDRRRAGRLRRHPLGHSRRRVRTGVEFDQQHRFDCSLSTGARSARPRPRAYGMPSRPPPSSGCGRHDQRVPVGRGRRLEVPRRALRVGRDQPVWVRLLRVSSSTSTANWASRCPARARNRRRSGRPSPRWPQAQPGDLVFFAGSDGTASSPVTSASTSATAR